MNSDLQDFQDFDNNDEYADFQPRFSAYSFLRTIDKDEQGCFAKNLIVAHDENNLVPSDVCLDIANGLFEYGEKSDKCLGLAHSILYAEFFNEGDENANWAADTYYRQFAADILEPLPSAEVETVRGFSIGFTLFSPDIRAWIDVQEGK